MSSGAGNKAELNPYRAAYAVSKAALDALARTYAAETATTSNVRVMVANPGPLRTKMRAAVAPGEDPMSLRTPEDFAPKVAALCAPSWVDTGKLYDFPSDSVKRFRAPE
jgi:NAD(P)-dependent dehydrogenase (short-subunit alcohol dehydrogenase family)